MHYADYRSPVTLKTKPMGLTNEQIEAFVADGVVRLDAAFPKRLATEARRRLWRDLDGDPNDPGSWAKPVQRLFYYWQKPFREAANRPNLRRAFDQLVGPGRWQPRDGLGTFVVRFPSDEVPSDTGWHVDLSFPPPDLDGVSVEDIDWQNMDWMSWRVNIHSRGRGLLMLFLFSDVGDRDAPTRIRVGSHLDIASLLEPAGEDGMDARQIDVAVSNGRKEVLATGPAGTVYLCHPFMVHAAQPHTGRTPRFLAQPELPLLEPFVLDRNDGDYSPVERAVRLALRGRSGSLRISSAGS